MGKRKKMLMRIYYLFISNSSQPTQQNIKLKEFNVRFYKVVNLNVTFHKKRSH